MRLRVSLQKTVCDRSSCRSNGGLNYKTILLTYEADTHPHQPSRSNQLTPFHNPRITDNPVSPSVSPGSVAWVLPKHTCATCPLDQILLDFIASRQSMLARGISPATVLGPEQLCPRDLLEPRAVDSTSHAISRVMAEVLTTFPHVNLPEKLAFMYLMHLTTRVRHPTLCPHSLTRPAKPLYTVASITERRQLCPHARVAPANCNADNRAACCMD